MNRNVISRLDWVVATLLLSSLCLASGCKQDSAGDTPPKLDEPAVDVDSPGDGPATDVPDPSAEDGHAKPAKDPVELNGPIFENWPRPQVAIVISGEQNGYLEPCGCAGLENQKGGLSRRHQLVKSLQQQGWPLVMADLGGQVRRFGLQAEIKYKTAFNALAQIGYHAVGFGPSDLRLPVEQLLVVSAELPPGKNPLVSANVGLLEFDDSLVARYRIVEVGGKKIGITSVLGSKYEASINNADVKFLPADDALAQLLPELREAADFLVLLSHATPEESESLAKRFPDFDVVITAGGADEPPNEAAKVEGTKARMVQVGHKGMYVAVLGLFDDPQMPFRYQRVPLDARFKDTPEMRAVMVNYQKELEALGLEGLGLLPPRPHSSGGKFVGSEACADCHSSATEVWENTTHAHATQTLVDLSPPRHFDPECLSCHVTGWNPQKYYPYASGYLDLEQTAQLRTNGCENCHGPGGAHVAAELGEVEVDEEMLDVLRKQMRLSYENAFDKCLECHDRDNSPDFHKEGAFEEYWKKVAHEGKD